MCYTLKNELIISCPFLKTTQIMKKEFLNDSKRKRIAFQCSTKTIKIIKGNNLG